MVGILIRTSAVATWASVPVIIEHRCRVTLATDWGTCEKITMLRWHEHSQDLRLSQWVTENQVMVLEWVVKVFQTNPLIIECPNSVFDLLKLIFRVLPLRAPCTQNKVGTIENASHSCLFLVDSGTRSREFVGDVSYHCMMYSFPLLLSYLGNCFFPHPMRSRWVEQC